MSVKNFLSFILSISLATGSISIAMHNSNGMTLDEKIGQMIMLDFRKWKLDGDSSESNVIKMNSEIQNIVKNYYIGNIILFSDNFSDEKQSKIFIAELRKLSGKIPMIIATDQEGGKVQRIKFGKSYNNNSDIKNSYEAFKKGYDIGTELKEYGVNCNLAPVADVFSNTENKVIGVRSFGCDPKHVSECCQYFVDGLHESGILATAKHFPGHGDTSTDSHISLPVVEKTKEELLKLEFVPFADLIKNNKVDMIMTAHILLPKIDKDCPATLSKTILTDILRKELNYDGVVVTDALDMGAIKSLKKEPVDLCTLAIRAGADILCMPLTLRQKKMLIS